MVIIVKEKDMDYEQAVAREISGSLNLEDAFALKVELLEKISYQDMDMMYRHDLTTRIFNQGSSLPEKIITGFWYNEDKEPIAKSTLENVVRNLKESKNYLIFSAVEEPSKLDHLDRHYASEFVLIDKDHQHKIYRGIIEKIKTRL
ncbi:hypothetical protein HYV89_00680 [Candidatus Woesearchaeota archaeon]|nr:hypothetical protein [Candidatus Woesearchaeota archaeon]